MGALDYYVLEGHTPVRVDDVLTWGQAYEDMDTRRVANDTIGSMRVSTIFLGIDHNFFGNGPPLLFETMIFGRGNDDYLERCSTWAEAEAMHARAVAWVRETLTSTEKGELPCQTTRTEK